MRQSTAVACFWTEHRVAGPRTATAAAAVISRISLMLLLGELADCVLSLAEPRRRRADTRGVAVPPGAGQQDRAPLTSGADLTATVAGYEQGGTVRWRRQGTATVR